MAGQSGYVTKALLFLNIAVFVISGLLGGSETFLSGGSELHLWGAVNGPGYIEGREGQIFLLPYPGIEEGGYYRLLTAMFLHYGIIHLAVNMYALWVLGRSLESVLGPIRFAALYLIAGIGGNVAAFVAQPTTLTAGASTSIYGLFAAYFLVLRRLGRDATSVIPIIVINIILTFTIPGISIAGHLGGLAAGAACGLGLAYAPRRNRTLIQSLVLAATFVVLMLITFVVSATR